MHIELNTAKTQLKLSIYHLVVVFIIQPKTFIYPNSTNMYRIFFYERYKKHHSMSLV